MKDPYIEQEFEFDILSDLFLTFACLILFLHLYLFSLPYRTCSVPCHFYALPIIVTLTRKKTKQNKTKNPLPLLFTCLGPYSLKGYGEGPSGCYSSSSLSSELLILISKELPSYTPHFTGLCSMKGMAAFKLYLLCEAFIDRFTF